MKFNISVFVGSLLWVISSVAAQSGRTVCTVTINSDDEKKIFQNNLQGQGFKFVELTDFAKSSDLEGSSADWFEKACASGVKCDVLMISGHFGGSFFGENEKNLTLSSNEMEKQSCKKTCDGIMKNPKEVFLFGCNTLAGKTTDSRTPEQYLQVLLQDGIERIEAERIVQARYGALGSSYKDRMRRIFSETQVIHGFDSVGPSGKTVRPFLEKFFKSSGDYNQRLNNLEGEKIVGLIEKANYKIRDINVPMAQAMSGTAYTYCSGIGVDEKLRDVKRMICSLQDPNIPESQKIKTIEKMLASPDMMIYVPSLASYINSNDFAADELKQTLKSNAKLKSVFEKLYKEYDSNSPTTAMEILRLRLQLGFINESQYASEVDKFANKRFARLDRENVDILCSLASDGVKFSSLNYDKIPAAAKSSPYLPMAADCLGTKDLRITKASIAAVPKLSGDDRAQALFQIGSMPGYDAEKLELARKNLNSKNKLDRVAAHSVIVMSSNVGADQIKSIEALIDLDFGYAALDGVQRKNIRSEALSTKIINRKKTISEQDLFLLTAITPADSKHWDQIIKSADQRDYGSYIVSRIYDRKERVEPLVSRAIKKMESPGEGYESQDNSRYLASVKLVPAERNRLFALLKNKPNQAHYIRGILKSQKVNYSAEEKKLLQGYASIHTCETVQETPNSTYTSCRDQEVE